MFLSDSHYYTLKANRSKRSNNIADLLALKFLLKLAYNNGVRDVQIYGDSLLVVSWMTGTQSINNVMLQALALHLKEIITVFKNCTIKSYIERELNEKVDTLSKEGLLMPRGEVLVREFSKGVSSKFQ